MTSWALVKTGFVAAMIGTLGACSASAPKSQTAYAGSCPARTSMICDSRQAVPCRCASRANVWETQRHASRAMRSYY